MIRINLLPHRLIKRAERQRQFTLMIMASAVVAVVIVILVQSYIAVETDSQKSRNTRLNEAIVKLDKQIEEIKQLKEKIKEVLERKQVVENLQSNRSQAVVILDELTRQLPEGMFFKSIKQKGLTITIEGITDTNSRVATLVRNLSNSQWLESPGLVEIKAIQVNGLRANDFIITVKLKVQKPPESVSKAAKDKKA
jgi:type IV pilus assembly protein PilN